MTRLRILSPEGRQEADLQPHTTLGRHPNNTVQILDRIASKEHCHIDWVDGRWVLRDLGSLNGTYVNGERVGERALAPGDEITMGGTRILFDAEGALRAGRPIPAGYGLSAAMPAVVTAPPPPPPAPMPPAPPIAQAIAPEPPQARAPLPKPSLDLARVTISTGAVESHIRTRLGMEQNFLPEALVNDTATLRRDYEKLRVSYELARAIGAELDIQKVLDRILAAAFQILQADRGIILLYDDDRTLHPRAVRTRAGTQDPNEPVIISNTIVEQVATSRQAVLSSDATVDSRFGGAHSIIMQGIRSSMAVPLLHSDELFGMMLLDSQIATNAFTEKDLQLFQNVANQAAIAVQNSLYARKLEAEAVTRERFQRLLSPAIAQQVLEGKVAIQKGGEGRDATVLFSDIRGFTSMSESENPQVIVDMLNEYFERMVEVIFEHEGTLDKFVGDEIMALFGAPVAHTDDPVRAVRTALEMLRVLSQLNRERLAKGDPAIHIGIGINSGHVVAGYIGSSKALEYTVIGDTVNTGARLCSLAKAGQIIISHSTLERLGNLFVVEELPPTQVKGKSLPLKVYNVVAERR